ncbi:WhiB family transcriptional regulator [Kineococcus indalonis]|uniref:WhiB family transcriptional regulator n=1 Tax=Kineococcus indalonis TaxID=2696566 RepID=UPI001411F796|nr:WhiB family transcriptional regulator [Kineococcus indalonis]NAZ87634.1 WhiB family transcriptional regulator [Kineococcus indalonis]
MTVRTTATRQDDQLRRRHARRDQQHVTQPARDEEVSGVQRRPATDPLPCRRYDSELWFAESPDDVELAKSLCSDCPLQSACLAGALERGEPWGVWGGQLVLAGVVVPRKRPRGRPRKHPVAA